MKKNLLNLITLLRIKGIKGLFIESACMGDGADNSKLKFVWKFRWAKKWNKI